MKKKSLVIVESPAKAKTIAKFLGSDFIVKSSYGHIRDLPSSKLNIDVEHNFKPTYQILPKSVKIVSELKEAYKKSKDLYIATDEDREGEAIGWHILHVLDLPVGKSKRIAFHEITEKAILKAIESPRQINVDLIDAWQARRILDRLVGYKLSPLLWQKITQGLSAGRVQSVAVRLIVEREEEIRKFKPEEFWEIAVDLAKGKDKFRAELAKIKDKKAVVKSGAEAGKIEKAVKKAKITVGDIVVRERKNSPTPPFKTSTLQQAAANKFGFTVKKTMRTAQTLYEGVDMGNKGHVGLITYMRTDSLHLADEAVKDLRDLIKQEFGEKYLPAKPNFYRSGGRAQEAHEAIRPTHINLAPADIKEYLNNDQFRLYKLIWQKTLACQMTPAITEHTQVKIGVGDYEFSASGTVIKFDGYARVYAHEKNPVLQEKSLPKLTSNEVLTLKKFHQEQKFTEPPSRYTEASLVKEMERLGIGRPSTYASTISTIQDRGYVVKEERSLVPQEIGELVNKFLVQHFPNIVDYEFTAQMEDTLDDIAEGKKEWRPVIKKFYGPFAKEIKEKEKTVDKKELTEEPSDEKCPECGAPMVIKLGRFGKFLACSKYPDCKKTLPLNENGEIEKQETNEKCSKCGKPMIIKHGRFGKFLACSGYPECRNTEPFVISTGVKCPKCGQGELLEKKTRKGKPFYGCSNYPKCKNAFWSKPVGICPTCQGVMTFKKDYPTCENCGFQDKAIK